MTRKLPANATDQKAATREAKGSVREAIGKLIGDDAEVSKGRAEQHAARRDRSDGGENA